jgi:hypothetical protein
MIQRIALAGLALILVAGIAGRLARALAPVEDYAAFHEAGVERFLERRGWSPGERVSITSDYTYSARVFRNPACWDPLLVSVVGAGSDAGGLYQRAGVREWRFVRNGVAQRDPPTLRFMLEQTFYNLARGAERPAPILAVSGPLAPSGSCDAPSPETWALLGRE